MSNLIKRIATALVAATVVLVGCYVGGWPFLVLLLAASLVAQHELYGLAEKGGYKPMKAVGLILGGLVALRTYVPIELVALSGIVVVALCAVAYHKRERLLADLGVTTLGVLYPTFLLSSLADIRFANSVSPVDAFVLSLLPLVLVWVSDSLAYFAGSAIGRHKLAPSISPKKTWEGAIAGAIGTIAAAWAVHIIVLPEMGLIHVIAIGIICGVVAPLGDLAESAMKRSVGVKDSGTLLPGHGGMLDRVDAMLISIPLTLLYLRYAIGLS